MCEITKKCNKCEQTRPITEFKLASGYKLGVFNICKLCTAKPKTIKKVIPEDHKECTYCKKVKIKTCFGLRNASKDGLCPLCKECKSLKDKQLRDSKTKFCHVCKKPAIDKRKGNFACELCCEIIDNIGQSSAICLNFKKCNTCKNVKHLTDYTVNKAIYCGYDNKCKSCQKIKNTNLIAKVKLKVEIKKCSKCLQIKPIIEFIKCNKGKDGFTGQCKKCKYKYIQDNYESITTAEKIWREANKVSIREKQQIHREKNKKELNRKAHEYRKNRAQSDPLYKLTMSIRILVREGIKNHLKQNFKSKNQTTSNILGCTFEEFKNHIESQFLPWMSWENHGNCKSNEYNCTWHLDHIIPISYAIDESEVYMLNHYSNFQPLCSRVNTIEKISVVLPVCNRELNLTVY